MLWWSIIYKSHIVWQQVLCNTVTVLSPIQWLGRHVINICISFLATRSVRGTWFISAALLNT